MVFVQNKSACFSFLFFYFYMSSVSTRLKKKLLQIVRWNLMGNSPKPCWARYLELIRLNTLSNCIFLERGEYMESPMYWFCCHWLNSARHDGLVLLQRREAVMAEKFLMEGDEKWRTRHGDVLFVRDRLQLGQRNIDW